MFIEIKSNINDYFKSGKLPVLLDSVGHLAHQPHMKRCDGFHCHHLLWVTDGEGVFTFQGKTITLHKGQGVYFRAGFPHEYCATKSGVFGTAWLTFYGLDGLLEHYGVGDCFLFDATDALNSSTRSLYSHSIGNSTVISRSAAAYSLITDFLASHFAPSAPLSDKVDKYLETRFADDLSLADIADAVGLNKYTLCKKYLNETGMTVMERFKIIRVAKAKQYLLNTSYPAETVGQMCGFRSPSYFGKIFREMTGKTPREYRIKHK